MPGPRPILFLLLSGLALQQTASAATYHLDAESGNDANSGMSPGQAWRSLARVDSHTFHPGDTLLFKVGTRYVGQLFGRFSELPPDPYAILNRPRLAAKRAVSAIEAGTKRFAQLSGPIKEALSKIDPEAAERLGTPIKP